MNEVIQFIKDYWTYISVVILVLFDLIVLLVKRRPKTLDDFKVIVSESLCRLPDMINYVEVPGQGAEKKAKVKTLLIGLVEKRLGRVLTKKENSLVEELSDSQIEAILTTPTKKEGK